MTRFFAAAVLLAVSVPLSALKIDIAIADVDRALTIARGSEVERSRFHASYIQTLDTPFVERAEALFHDAMRTP